MFLLNTQKKNIPENVSDSFDKFLKKEVQDLSSESEKAIKFENGLCLAFSKISLFYKKEPTVSLGYFSYLGNDYFIGFLNPSTILQIKLYNELYKLWIHPTLELNIIEVNLADNIGSDLVIIKTLHDEYFDNLKVINLITPDHFLSCEQLTNKYVCMDENGKENWLKVEKITVQFFIVDHLLQLVRGALLLSNNSVVGIFSHMEGQKCFFYRLSHVYEWISKFVPNFSNKSVYSINPQVPFYTKEQLLIIISHLNHKIDTFTTKLEDIDKNSLKTSFKLLSDSNEIKKEEHMQNMVETINFLTNKVNTQEQQIKQITTVLKKLGFNNQ